MLDNLLKKVFDVKASDLYISVGLPPTVKVNGQLESLNSQALNSDQVYGILKATMGDARFAEFRENKEANFALQNNEIGRFRISAYMQKEEPAMVARRIESIIPTFDDLYLPEQLKKTCLVQRGLILFVGATGSGKSSTQAAMIGYRNQHQGGHILTIEDPIEYVHNHGKSVMTQREIGIDSQSYEIALKNALRQAPDVILIGEIRDRSTMEFAITFAETGHLCLATMHANNANQAIDRILHLVPEDRHRQFLFDLSVNLKAIVAQQLIPKADGKGRRAAFEILYNTPTMADAIQKGKLESLKEIIQQSTEHGMQTFDQALFDLYEQGTIGHDEALAHADSTNDIRLMIKLNSSKRKEISGSGGLENVTLGT
ncbi:MAG: PilT/PilU family type 4a pilus ATPase [Psychromonas sp.]|nr:PilT/PilU family type 4a pilus ATPase [Psychromonas sp.]